MIFLNQKSTDQTELLGGMERQFRWWNVRHRFWNVPTEFYRCV